MYVANQGYHRIQVLKPDLNVRTRRFAIGSPTILSYPNDIAFDIDNNVYVTDSGNGRILVFSQNGNCLKQIGKKGTGEGELLGPNMIAIDKDLIYVSELGNNRVSVFARNGDHLMSFGSEGDGPLNFKQPFGIAVDKSGKVYVCDCGNNRIQVFKNPKKQ